MADFQNKSGHHVMMVKDICQVQSLGHLEAT